MALKDSYNFYVAGVQFHRLKEVINELNVGDVLALIPEPTNKFDPNAVAIKHYSEGLGEEVMCGYVPKKISADVSAYLATTEDVTCKVKQLSKTAKTWEMLFVEVSQGGVSNA